MGAIDNDRCSAGTATASSSIAVRVHGLPPPEVFAYNSDHKELLPSLDDLHNRSD